MDFDVRHRLHAQNRVPIEVLGGNLAAFAEDDLTPGRGPEPPQQAALDLCADQIRIEDDTAVEGEHDALDVNALALVLGDLNDLRTVTEIVGAGNTARVPRSGWRSPPGAVRGELERAHR